MACAFLGVIAVRIAEISNKSIRRRRHRQPAQALTTDPHYDWTEGKEPHCCSWRSPDVQFSCTSFDSFVRQRGSFAFHTRRLAGQCVGDCKVANRTDAGAFDGDGDRSLYTRIARLRLGSLARAAAFDPCVRASLLVECYLDGSPWVRKGNHRTRMSKNQILIYFPRSFALPELRAEARKRRKAILLLSINRYIAL